jgi:ABC-2 type transport system ATP-binding protein
MSRAATIEVTGLRKRFGSTVALDGMSFTVRPGQVTGFVGPNGAGKSTTMRVILGLDAADAGNALIGGQPYRRLRCPLRHVGALLDAAALQPSRTARNHLLWLAHSQGLPAHRVDAVIEQAGLRRVARREPAASPWACGSGSGSPRRCSATRRCSTAWFPRASCGCAASWVGWPQRAARCWCPAT